MIMYVHLYLAMQPHTRLLTSPTPPCLEASVQAWQYLNCIAPPFYALPDAVHSAP